MSDWRESYDGIAKEIDELKETKASLRDLLDFYGNVLDAQRSVRERFAPDTDGIEEPCKTRNTEGSPCLSAADVKIDWSLFKELFDRVVDLSRDRIKTEKKMEKWSSVVTNETEGPAGLLEAIFEGKDSSIEEYAGRAGMSPGVFLHLTYHTLVPFLEAYAEKLKDCFDDAKWQKGFCPACGGEPVMGRLHEETGKRELQCQLCRTTWTFKRMECPYCGCDEQKSLRYFYDEDEPCYRVEVCDSCKRYLKSVDLRKKNEELSLITEDLATIHLDLVAEQEGFQAKIEVL